MLVAEWIKPGTFVVCDDQETNQEIVMLLHGLESCLTQCCVLLNLIETTGSIFPRASSEDFLSDMHFRVEQRRVISNKLNEEHGICCPFENGEEFWRRKVVAEQEISRALLERGRVPNQYKLFADIALAESFVGSADMFGKIIKGLKKIDFVNRRIEDIEARYYQSIPDLKGVRDSIQHKEERLVGKSGDKQWKGQGKKMNLREAQANPNGSTSLISANLSGSYYCATMANGKNGKVEISSEVVNIMTSALLEVFDIFEWKGPKSYSPFL